MNDQAGNLLKKVAKGTMWSFAGFLLGRLANFLLYILISKIYGPACMGLFMTSMMFLRICQCPASLGFRKGAMRYMAIAHEREDWGSLKRTMAVSLVLPAVMSVVLSVFLYVGIPKVLAQYFSDPRLGDLLRMFTLSILFVSLMGISAEMTRAFKDVRRAVLIEDIIFPFSLLVTFVLLYLMGYGFKSIAFALLVTSVMSCMAGLWLAHGEVTKFGGRIGSFVPMVREAMQSGYMKEITLFSFPFACGGLILMGHQAVDLFMLNILSSSHNVGIYSAGVRTAMLLASLMFCCTQILSPIIAGEYGAIGRESHVGTLYRAVARWMFCVVLPCFAFILMAPGPILMMFGREFVDGATPVLIILSLGQVVYSVCGASAIVLGMTGHHYKEMGLMAGGIVLNIILNLLLIPRMGIIGAAVATTTSRIAVNAFRVALVYYTSGESFLRWGYIPALLVCAFFFWVRSLIPWDSLGFAFAPVIYGVFVALLVAICAVLTTMTSGDHDILKRLPKLLLRRGPRPGRPQA